MSSRDAEKSTRRGSTCWCSGPCLIFQQICSAKRWLVHAAQHFSVWTTSCLASVWQTYLWRKSLVDSLRSSEWNINSCTHEPCRKIQTWEALKAAIMSSQTPILAGGFNHFFAHQYKLKSYWALTLTFTFCSSLSDHAILIHAYNITFSPWYTRGLINLSRVDFNSKSLTDSLSVYLGSTSAVNHPCTRYFAGAYDIY